MQEIFHQLPSPDLGPDHGRGRLVNMRIEMRRLLHLEEAASLVTHAVAQVTAEVASCRDSDTFQCSAADATLRASLAEKSMKRAGMPWGAGRGIHGPSKWLFPRATTETYLCLSPVAEFHLGVKSFVHPIFGYVADLISAVAAGGRSPESPPSSSDSQPLPQPLPLT